MIVVRVGLILVVAFLAAGCHKTSDATGVAGTTSAASASTHAPETNRPLYLDRAQPKLPTIKLWIGPHEMAAEMALTQTQVATGMMYRKEMGENDGMIFVFPRPHQTAFYMRNTQVPLSAAYIDTEGTILELHDLKPLDETPIEAGTDKIQYVLETPRR